jgi:hypothetical protein
MQLSFANGSICETNPSDSLPFPPSTGPIDAPEARKFANRSTDGKGFNVRELANYFEVHNGATIN